MKVNNQLEKERHMALLSRDNLQEQSKGMMEEQLHQLEDLKREKVQ